MSAVDATLSSGQASNHKFTWFKRIVTVVFFIAVPVFLFFLVKNVNWHEVGLALKNLNPVLIALGLGVALTSYLVYSSYDLLGRKYSGHSLPVQQVLAVAFICYAFTLNLSYWVGGFALRFRLYSRLGLTTAVITKVFTLSVITNWLGYMILAGILFSCRLLDLPDDWKIGTTGLQIVGVILLLLASIYLGACKFAKRRSWRVFKQKIVLPEFTLAITQACLAMINWSLMALIIFILLPAKVSYLMVLGVFLVCAMAGAIAHIPGGLGVLEAIFVTMLQHQIPKGEILAALIGYRVTYFLIPLGIASTLYLVLESRAKKLRVSNQHETPEAIN